MDGRLRIALVLLSLCACQKPPVNETKLIDNSNSEFSNKGCYGTAIPNRYIIHWKSGSVSIVNDMDRDQVLNKLIPKYDNQLEFIEQDRMLRTAILNESEQLNSMNSSAKISDPKTKVDLNSVAPLVSVNYWGQEKVEVADVWDQKVLGQNVPVAIIDSGVDISHPQLKNQVYINENEIPDNQIDDDHNGFVDDYYGYDFKSKSPNIVPVGNHGTHVAGIIAADPKFGPIIGMAPKAKIIPLNFMNKDGEGSLGDAILAIEYAINRGAKIINASWGGDACAASFRTEISKLSKKNILFVVASGNSGVNLDYKPEYPAAFHEVAQLTVGATMPSDRMAGFSNFSETLVDLMAPGSLIWSTVPVPKKDDNSQNSETVISVWPMSGTSMATPFVSGAAALLWGKYPNATFLQIKEALLKSVDVNDYPVVSKGRLNVKKALEYLKSNQ